MDVHVLVTCRDLELLRASTLVFDSLRKGFPTSRIIVHLNTTFPEVHSPAIQKAILSVGPSSVLDAGKTIHHEWIYELVENATGEFYIVDTDVVLWSNVESLDHGNAPLAGRFTPEFFCSFVKCITRCRLHTALLYFNPARIAEELEKYHASFSNTEFQPRPNLIFPTFHSVRCGSIRKDYFNDTCSLLYHAIGGKAFSDEENDSHDHLHNGTISNLVGEAYGDDPRRQNHFAVFENPSLLKGAWRNERKFFAARPA